MCASVWSEACTLYTNDAMFVWCVPRSLNTSRLTTFFGPMFAYLEWLHATLHDFNVLLPPSANVMKDFENHNMFFMTLGLYGI